MPELVLIERESPREPWARAVSRLRWRVPVLSQRDTVVVSAFSVAWLLALANFTAWWVSASHIVTVPRLLVASLVLSVTLFMPWWLLTAVRRMRRPNPALPVPDVRPALVVTKSPGEPWPVVQRTLVGMLHQDHQGPFDVWLADEAPTETTLAWCDAHGVHVSTRSGEPRYHREQWPRRTRCKEGNLAYFYDHWGYDLYDVVVQFDADHVPERKYLDTVLRCFADPAVGYVAAPSICDANADRSWSARGRLFREATLQGPVQAGHNDGMAPTCIGSHYAVRTKALREVGGVGPELAEDFSTSFIMNACGWRGASALDAIAHGDGPETFADAMVQELQWSRSLQVLMMRYCKPLWQDIPPRERWKLRFALWWYPLFAAQMAVGFLLPIVAMFTARPWVRINLLEFATRVGLMSLLMVAFVAWLRSRRVLRPVDAKILSWESMLFQLARWPWVLLGVVQGWAGSVLDRQFDFKVTPKGAAGARDLPLLSIAPHIALSVVASLSVLVSPDPGPARGYYLLVVLSAATYSAVTWAVTLLHLRENKALPLRRLAPHFLAGGATTTLVVGAVAAHGERILGSGRGALAAIDPAGLVEQPSTWLWALAVVLVPLYVRRLRTSTDRRALLADAVPASPPTLLATVPASPRGLGSAQLAHRQRTMSGVLRPSRLDGMPQGDLAMVEPGG